MRVCNWKDLMSFFSSKVHLFGLAITRIVIFSPPSLSSDCHRESHLGRRKGFAALVQSSRSKSNNLLQCFSVFLSKPLWSQSWEANCYAGPFCRHECIWTRCEREKPLRLHIHKVFSASYPRSVSADSHPSIFHLIPAHLKIKTAMSAEKPHFLWCLKPCFLVRNGRLYVLL